MLEEIMAVAVARAPRYRPAWMRDEALRSARTCYDHLAGRLGVALAGSLAGSGHVVLDDDGGEVTEDGARFLDGFGLDLAGAAGKAPPLLPALSSTGASGGRISAARSARRWPSAASRSAGSSGSKTAARSRSPHPAATVFSPISASKFPPPEKPGSNRHDFDAGGYGRSPINGAPPDRALPRKRTGYKSARPRNRSVPHVLTQQDRAPGLAGGRHQECVPIRGRPAAASAKRGQHRRSRTLAAQRNAPSQFST